MGGAGGGSGNPLGAFVLLLLIGGLIAYWVGSLRGKKQLKNTHNVSNTTGTINDSASLSDCPACGRTVSQSAATCPQCGHPLKSIQTEKKPSIRGWQIGLTIIAVLWFWNLFFGSKANETNNVKYQASSPVVIEDKSPVFTDSITTPSGTLIVGDTHDRAIEVMSSATVIGQEVSENQYGPEVYREYRINGHSYKITYGRKQQDGPHVVLRMERIK
ncbi:MAG: zinc ribbon domain-containing protein [Humidesulfovibrio sp.]|nr:zinc ribbon domain-containing protein [Humidesulfovibrio sp.]